MADSENFDISESEDQLSVPQFPQALVVRDEEKQVEQEDLEVGRQPASLKVDNDTDAKAANDLAMLIKQPQDQ